LDNAAAAADDDDDDYTRWPQSRTIGRSESKKVAAKVVSDILPNVDRFSKFLHQDTHTKKLHYQNSQHTLNM